jgi:hypothetical protein
MRPRIVNRVDIMAFLQTEKRRQRVYGTLVRMTSDECDLPWAEAKTVVNNNLKHKTLGHLLRHAI